MTSLAKIIHPLDIVIEVKLNEGDTEGDMKDDPEEVDSNMARRIG